jgi:multidrug transporter EmrE-like cation transporter
VVSGKAIRLFTASVLPSFPVANIKCISTGEDDMNAVKMLAIVLIVAGGMGLAYGSFTYTKDTHEAKLGPIALTVKDTETVNVPVWAGVGAIVAGVILLFVRK